MILCPSEDFNAYNPKVPIQKQTVEFYTQRSPELATLIGDGENVNREDHAGKIKRALCSYLGTYLAQWGPQDETFKAAVGNRGIKSTVIEKIQDMLKGPNVVLLTGLKAKLEQTLQQLLTPDVPQAVEELQAVMQAMAPYLSTPGLQDAYQGIGNALFFLGSSETALTRSLSSQQGIAQQGKAKKKKTGN